MYRVTQGRSLVLASASPRRSELLRRVGLEFLVRPVEVDESLISGEGAQRSAGRLALAKARAAEAPESGAAVLTADTLVALGDTVLGKPRDAADARSMLGQLSGQEHQVVTGFTLRLDDEFYSAMAQSKVRFRTLTNAEINAYVAGGEPMGKAGAYAIQGMGAALVEEVSGSYTNVVGLPLAAVIKLLLARGVIQPKESE